MIKSITMKSCATYSQEGSIINDCKKVNIFYGPNGSGKSTIGKFLSDKNGDQYSECKIEWENDKEIDVLVYNREFRERNIREEIDGIFTLGSDAIEIKDKLDEMETNKTEKQKEYGEKEKELNKEKEKEAEYKKKFKEDLWDKIYKSYNGIFSEVFISKLRTNKEKFKDEVIERHKKIYSSSETKESLIQRRHKLFSQELKKHPLIEVQVDNIVTELSRIESDSIWEKVVVGNKDIDISELIIKLDNADWVNKGRSYIKEDDGVCPFCQQKTITSELRQKLEDFFSGEYERKIKYIEGIINKYKAKSNDLISKLSSAVSDEGRAKVAEIKVSEYNSLIEILKRKFSGIEEKMVSKKNEPSKKITIKEDKEEIDKLLDIIKVANNNIIENNKMSDNYDEEKKKLIDDIWNFLVDEQKSFINSYLRESNSFDKKIKGLNEELKALEKDLDKLKKDIIEIKNKITSVQPSVDKINSLLKGYGFTNFQIVPFAEKKNSYQIQRLDGTFVEGTLSEGEETFIAFLYFFQLAEGSVNVDKLNSKKILVFDDPICSLDSTILYIVSSMVKELINKIKKGKSDVEQIFILTHNVYFHKEVSSNYGRNKKDLDVYYWIISKDNNVSSIRSYKDENPIKGYYELLWNELRTNENVSLVTMQNIMRRILEYYFKWLGGMSINKIYKSFDTLEDNKICWSLYSWINDGSHSIPDDIYIDGNPDIINRYKIVFEKIFIKLGHKAHYDMMMGLNKDSKTEEQ